MEKLVGKNVVHDFEEDSKVHKPEQARSNSIVAWNMHLLKA